jgi:carbon-monoxide dehydrogenase large subunit
VIAGSFMDYAMPRAHDFCPVLIEDNPVPTPTNPLGVKGAGEAGATGAPPAVISAILDALRPLGIAHIDMPATPNKIWHAIQGARAGKVAAE